MPKIVSFRDIFRHKSDAVNQTKSTIQCEHPPCNFCAPSSPNGTTEKSAFCHEKGQKVDNSSAVIRKIAELCESQEFSDLVLIVAGKRYYTHKLLLCCASDVFQIMLMNPSWPDAQKGEITLVEEKECLPVFKDFLRYLYSGVIHFTHYNVLPILMLADKYNVCHLRVVCLEYMYDHIVSTTTHNHAVSWLQYAYLCGHRTLAEVCHHFILCNFHKVMSTDDYLLMHKEVLLDFLHDSYLVVPDEFTIFQGVVHWLQNQKWRSFAAGSTESRRENILGVLSSIRFPMMSLAHLCQLEKEALTNDFHSFFMENISRAMQYHSSCQAQNQVNPSEEISQCEARNYTNDTWSTSLTVENLSAVVENEMRPLMFTSPVSGSEADENKSWGWNVEFFPKGIQFQKCIMVGLWRNVEICGSTFKTVRLKLESDHPEERNVHVSILIAGVQDSVEHVKHVIMRHCKFDKTNRVQVFNDIVPYNKLNQPCSEYLTGSSGSTFKISIIIKPV